MLDPPSEPAGLATLFCLPKLGLPLKEGYVGLYGAMYGLGYRGFRGLGSRGLGFKGFRGLGSKA